MGKKLETRVVTNKVRFSFVNLAEPRAVSEGQTPKYSVMLLIPKSDIATITKIKTAIDVASKRMKPVPRVVKHTLKDADTDVDGNGVPFVEKWQETAGHYIITVSNTRQPGMVDATLQRVLDPSLFYSGCYGRADINFFAYDSNGNKGVSASLNNVQFLEDGEPLGNVYSPEDAFGG